MRGTRVFVELHGRTYAALTESLRDSEATRAVGVSMGADAILGAIDEFERIVLLLPAGHRPNDAHNRLAEAIDDAELERIARALRVLQPAGIRDRDDVLKWSEQRARELQGSDVADLIRGLADQRPDHKHLDEYRGSALVIAQEDDPIHPVEAAEVLARQLPHARLEVFPAGGLLWSHRDKVREVVSGFLNAD